MYFSRWKIITVIAAIVLGMLIALPNVASRDTLAKLPGWVPTRQVNLGLDLRGGGYLLLQGDMDTLNKGRMENALDSARAALRTAKIPFTSAELQGNAIQIVLRDPAQTADARAALGKLDTAQIGAPNTLDISTAGPGEIKVVTTDAAIRDRVSDALKQSVEIVRRRVDPDGVKNPQISQQPPDRILVELPGEKDLDSVKKRLNVVAKMDFHLVDETGHVDAVGHPPPGDLLLVDDSMKSRN